MKIGLISDTHCCSFGPWEIPSWIENAFKGADIIVHAGDVESPGVLRALEHIAPVYAVRGNCDPSELKTPYSISIDIGCGKLTAAHRPGDAQNAVEIDTKIIVCGHTHISTISEYDGIVLVNPGSPAYPRGGMPPSVGIIDISSTGNIFPQIVTKY